MEFTINKDTLIKPLQLMSGVVEKKQTLPVLSNILISVSKDEISLTGTDLEVELVTRIQTEQVIEPGELTVPAKKLTDICKSMPDGSLLELRSDDTRLILKRGRSRFTLSTLPASEFPNVEDNETDFEFPIEQSKLKALLEKTYFAMAQQDVRYYLNGILFEINQSSIKSVATDGHRLALSEVSIPTIDCKKEIIIPRKGVIELLRLLDDSDDLVNLVIGPNHIRAKTPSFTFTSKLIEGKFPNYQMVIPKNGDRIVVADKTLLKQALSRTSILTHEKYHGIRMQLEDGLKKLSANNAENEHAEEEIAVDYSGAKFEIGLNVNYLQDAISAIGTPEVKLTFKDSDSSILVESNSEEDNSLYVIMPMRL